MQSKVKVTPYHADAVGISIKDLVQIKGRKTIHIVVSRIGTTADILPLVNRNGDFAGGYKLKRFDVCNLIHYNGDITISQRV